MAYKNNIDLESVESRRVLAKLVLCLFQLWKIDARDQITLLDLSDSPEELSRYARGDILPSHDLLDREAWLLSIFESLWILYPENPEIRYSWVNRRNTAFNDATPFEVMKKDGFAGIAKVGRHLEFRLEQ